MAHGGESVGIAFALVITSGLCTVVGGAMVFCIKATNHAFLSASLGLAAGVMVYVSFVEIFSVSALDSFQEAGVGKRAAARYATLGFFGGAALTWMLDKVADKMVDAAEALQERRERAAAAARKAGGCVEIRGGAAHEIGSQAASERGIPNARSSSSLTAFPSTAQLIRPAEEPSAPGRRSGGGCGSDGSSSGQLCVVCCDPMGLEAAVQLRKGEHGEIEREEDEALEILAGTDGDKLSRLGVLAALAVGIHNLPEGVATFIATMASAKLGAIIVVAIALHNIPEGICIAMPIYFSTGSRWRALLLCLVAGLAEPVGGLLGWLVLAQAGGTPLPLAIMFSVVSGMMVYISLAELLPTAFKYDPSSRLATGGLFTGMVIMAVSLLLFNV